PLGRPVPALAGHGVDLVPERGRVQGLVRSDAARGGRRVRQVPGEHGPVRWRRSARGGMRRRPVPDWDPDDTRTWVSRSGKRWREPFYLRLLGWLRLR